MCVIVFKPAGAECPSLDCLESCWDSNPDGAGLAVSEGKKVFLQKGFMSFSKLKEYYTENGFKDRVDQAILFHFRIGTHGKKDAGNTHPFPVSQSPDTLRALTGRHNILVAHNGIFQNKVTLPDVSDTGQFLADCAAAGGDPVDFWNKNKTVTGWSRMAVLKPGGRYTLLGDWHCDKDCGCFFSNGSWKMKKVYVTSSSVGRTGGVARDDFWDNRYDFDDRADYYGGSYRNGKKYGKDKHAGKDKATESFLPNPDGLTESEWEARMMAAIDRLGVPESAKGGSAASDGKKQDSVGGNAGGVAGGVAVVKTKVLVPVVSTLWEKAAPKDTPVE